jgi:phage-related tail protein
LALALVFLAGCARQSMGPLPAAVERAAPVLDRTVAEEVRADVRTSANQTQQSVTGLGANLGKVAESVTGIGGDLARLSASVESNVRLQAEIKAKVEAAVSAQAGLKNELEQWSMAVKAGRDSTVETVQFTREMAQTIQRQSLGTVLVVLIMAAVLVWDKDKSRRRAEARAAEHLALLKEEKHAPRP